MIIPDVNLLVFAYNRAAPEHDQARAWWEDCLSSGLPVGLPWISSTGFIRLMTHPRVLQLPMPIEQATAEVRRWLAVEHVLVPEPRQRFPALLLNFLDTLGAGANLTTDAYLAALAVEHQAELHSNDTDFGRFPGLRWRNPLTR